MVLNYTTNKLDVQARERENVNWDILNGVIETVGNMQPKVTQAGANATEALNKSNQAVSTSNTAKDTADSAKRAAENAVNTADGIDGKATEALNKSNQAVSTSNSAKDVANSAKTTANATAQQLETLILESGTSDAELVAMRYDTNTGESFPTAGARVDDITVKLSHLSPLSEYMTTRLRETSVNVKVIGDSITAGQGAIGYATPTTQPVILQDGSTTYYEATYNTQSFSNLLRNFILSKNPSNTFQNWGIGGRYVTWWNTRRQHITSEDIVIVQLGTNDRVNSTSLESFKTNYTDFLLYLRGVSNYVIVMIANPNATSSEMVTSNYKFTQSDVNDAVKEICLKHNFPCISHFDAFMEFNATNSNYTKLLADDIHPSNDGYQIMWQSFQKALNIYDVEYQETKKPNRMTVTPENFTDFLRIHGNSNSASPNNVLSNPLLSSWDDATTPTGFTLNNVACEQVPSLEKGEHALKLTSTASNGFATSARQGTSFNKFKMLVIYESVGTSRLQILQIGNVEQRLNVTLPSGKNMMEFEFELSDDFDKQVSYRVYPNISQTESGFLTLDAIIAVPIEKIKEGYFSVEIATVTNQYAIAKLTTAQSIPHDVATFLKLDTITPYNGMDVTLDSNGRFILPKGCYVIDAYVQLSQSTNAVGYRQIASSVYTQRFPAISGVENILHISRFAEVLNDGDNLSVTVRHTQGEAINVLTAQTNVVIRRVY